MNNRPIVGIGGMAMDVISRCISPIVLRDSNPGVIFSSPGGVTRNVCENLARQGSRVCLLSVVGDDPLGRAAIDCSAQAGIDMSHIRVSADKKTASYLAILDNDGDMAVASSDFSVIDELTEEVLRENLALIRGAAAIVTDANLTTEQLSAILSLAGDIPVFLDPVSEAKAVRAKDLIGSFAMVKPNVMELEALSEVPCRTDSDIENACSVLLSKGCDTVVVSLGSRGCYYADCEGTRMFRRLSREVDMVNATGAGDAFLAGYVSGFVKGLSVTERIDRALAAGAIAVLSESTINPEMSEARIEKMLREEGVVAGH